jgi:hypothetical protein
MGQTSSQLTGALNSGSLWRRPRHSCPGPQPGVGMQVFTPLTMCPDIRKNVLGTPEEACFGSNSASAAFDLVATRHTFPGGFVGWGWGQDTMLTALRCWWAALPGGGLNLAGAERDCVGCLGRVELECTYGKSLEV